MDTFLLQMNVLKGQSNEILDLYFFHYSIKSAWATDQWVKILLILFKILWSYSSFRFKKTDWVMFWRFFYWLTGVSHPGEIEKFVNLRILIQNFKYFNPLVRAHVGSNFEEKLKKIPWDCLCKILVFSTSKLKYTDNGRQSRRPKALLSTYLKLNDESKNSHSIYQMPSLLTAPHLLNLSIIVVISKELIVKE